MLVTHKMIKLAAIISLVLLAGGFRQADWPKFKSTEENFTIAMPSEPRQERNSARGPFGNGHHIYSVESNGVSYTVSNSVFDNPPTQPKDIKRILDSARDLVLMVTGGKLLSDKGISLEDFPGREVRIEKDKKIWTLHAYVVKGRMYQLMTTEPKAKEQNPDTAKFFDSFKLLAPPE
jgi:hypothetical protein